MRREPVELVLRQVYDMAALVESSVITHEPMVGELDWSEDYIQETYARFSQISLLHHYIFATIAVYHRRMFRKETDLWEIEDIYSVEGWLEEYSIPFQPFDEWHSMHPDIDESHQFYQWFLSQEDSFDLLWEKLTDEAFHLVFANRQLLLAFNQSVADFVMGGRAAISPKYLAPDGGLRRQPIPRWARDAVFFRDHGRCVLCGADLSGLLSTDRSVHIDHMVPLASWGANDPTNLQLLCESCNLKKGSGAPVTSRRYPSWW